MLELILFGIAFIGSLAAGLWDLKTTEIPDEIPTLMIALGVALWLMSGNIYGFALSMVFGISFLLFGWLLYKAGQWGGGDAKMLSAIGFLIPLFGGRLLALDFFFNLFFVGLFYMVVYSVALGFLNKGTFSTFGKAMTREKIISAVVIALIVVSGLTFVFISESMVAAELLLILALLMLFWKYSKTVENNIFKKKIPTSKLRVGDVLLESKQWDGISEEDLAKIKRSGKKFVTIKEGVRFGMVFFIALIVTYFAGNIIFFLVGM
jgi:Flp pilus assembly protein protease CpaA